MGLGSKKANYMEEDAWIDDDYLEVFDKNHRYFSRVDSRLCKQLYKHNQIAVNRQERYLASVEGVIEERQLIYVNSGLHCIEKEIVEFAKKYALYNKCAQAQEYLDEAIDKTAEIMDAKEAEKKAIEEKIKNEQESAKKQLLAKLEQKISTCTEEFKIEYPTRLKQFVSECVKSYEQKIEAIVERTWKDVEGNDKKKRVSLFLSSIKSSYLSIQRNFSGEISKYSKMYWDEKRRILQGECCNLIKEDESLSPDERSYLQQFIMELELPKWQEDKINISEDDIRKYFLVFRRNDVNKAKTKELFKDNLSGFSRRIIAKIKESHGKGFDNWSVLLCGGLVEKMGSLNPRLRAYTEQLAQLQGEIEELQEQEYRILENQEKISAMFILKERG